MTEPRNRFRSFGKAVSVGTEFWDACVRAGLAGIVAELDDDALVTLDGHRFVNFSCCSYLDLDSHPWVREGAIQAIRRYGVLDHCIPRTRLQLPLLLELEETLSDLFRAQVVTAISASVASQGLLPLIAAGQLLGSQRPILVFDKNCHVSMAQVKAVCADETEVITCAHHDLDRLEDLCKRNPAVCYVCDGADSLGGFAPVAELRELQSRLGLRVFYDDSHSLSIQGARGEGYVRSQYESLDHHTLIVATLNKAFGAAGAAVMLGNQGLDALRRIERFAGALAYSQPMNTAAIGAAQGSARVHRTEELGRRQAQLQDRIRQFDARIHTRHRGSPYPIRLVPVSDTDVIRVGRAVFEAGFYVSPVFFPIVRRGTAGLRVMLRSGQDPAAVDCLCGVLRANGLHE